MSLAETLDRIREAGEAKRPPEWTAVMKRAVADLAASDILDAAVGVGDEAPSFSRPNLRFETVRSGAVLKEGPVVLSFFRGRW